MNETKNVKAVFKQPEIVAIEYQVGQDWEEAVGDVQVLVGTDVTFRVVVDAPSYTCGCGGPLVWSGTSGASGTGPETTVSFETLSQSTSDYRTVTATCNNEMSVNVIVFDLEVVLEPDDNFQGRSLIDFGVEENITLQHDETPDGVALNLEWVQLSGVGDLIANRLDAGAVPGQASFQLRVLEGPSTGMGRHVP